MRHGAPQTAGADPATGAATLGSLDLQAVWRQLQDDARALGFSQIAVADVDLSTAEPGFCAWLEAGFAGGMDYMAAHGLRRLRPAELVPGTRRVVTVRMDYLPLTASAPDGSTGPSWQEREWRRLAQPTKATISVYARGRDYHKVVRQRLAQLAQRLQDRIGPFGHRAFTDSAPVAEVELAQRSGLGWRGKNTLLLSREGGSMFFLGELFVDLPLPLTTSVDEHCGHCTACLTACPTQAIVAPYQLDARRCISYFTIEHAGPIDPALRPLMGNRIYGCDDCQLVCPWNKYARVTPLADFRERPSLQDPELLTLWTWTEADFLRHTEGSPIRRIGYERWRRNLAVALGNGVRTAGADQLAWVQAARVGLESARAASSEMVREHIDWALSQDAGAAL